MSRGTAGKIAREAPPRARDTWLAPPAIRGMRAAFIFLTRVPLGGFPYRPDDWTWAAAHAPLVGLFVGAVTGGVVRVLMPLGPLSAALFAIGASLLVTGAFHEDGLADTSDALGGAYDKDRVLEILKDSRIGTFGAAALVISIVGRASLIADMGALCSWALPVVGCAARVGPIWQMALLRYVTQSGAKSRQLVRGGALQAFVATGWLVVTLGITSAAHLITLRRVVSLVAVLISVTLFSAWRYHRRAGGITGDFLGATEQLCELAALAALVWTP